MRAKEQTITENLALFQVQNAVRLKKIRREIRRLERRYWWARIKRWLRG